MNRIINYFFNKKSKEELKPHTYGKEASKFYSFINSLIENSFEITNIHELQPYFKNLEPKDIETIKNLEKKYERNIMKFFYENSKTKKLGGYRFTFQGKTLDIYYDSLGYYHIGNPKDKDPYIFDKNGAYMGISIIDSSSIPILDAVYFLISEKLDNYICDIKEEPRPLCKIDLENMKYIRYIV